MTGLLPGLGEGITSDDAASTPLARMRTVWRWAGLVWCGRGVLLRQCVASMHVTGLVRVAAVVVFIGAAALVEFERPILPRVVVGESGGSPRGAGKRIKLKGGRRGRGGRTGPPQTHAGVGLRRSVDGGRNRYATGCAVLLRSICRGGVCGWALPGWTCCMKCKLSGCCSVALRKLRLLLLLRGALSLYECKPSTSTWRHT